MLEICCACVLCKLVAYCVVVLHYCLSQGNVLVQQQNGCYGVVVPSPQHLITSYQMQQQPPSYESPMSAVKAPPTYEAPPLPTIHQQSLATSSAAAAAAMFVPADVVYMPAGSGAVTQSTTNNNSSVSLPPQPQFDLRTQPDVVCHQSAPTDFTALPTGLYQAYWFENPWFFICYVIYHTNQILFHILIVIFKF